MGVSRESRRNITKKLPDTRPDARVPLIGDLGLYAGLLCLTLLVYLPALYGGLVWDDNMHVTRPDLRSVEGLWRIWFDLGATQQYYPLLHSAFWLEHRIWGDAVLGYHLTNVVLHATSALLVIKIARRLAIPGAWLAGFLFALHPVCVEGVAWISEQKSTLSGVFCLSAALFYLEFDQSRRRTSYLIALLLFILALLSKTVTALLAPVLLVILWWKRGSLHWKHDALPLLPWFAIGIPAGLFTAWVERSPALIGAQGPDYGLTLAQRLLLAGRVPWFYAWKTVWPSNLMFVYPRWKIDPQDLSQYLFPLSMAALTAALVWLAARRKMRGPLAGFLIFTGALFPVLGFLNVYPFRYSYVADHFQYLALLGILVPAAAAITALSSRVSTGKIAAIALPGLLLSSLATATWHQSGAYRDYETLFRETMARNPGSALVHNNLGVILMSSGREAEALPILETAVRLEPQRPDYRVNFGLALAQVPGRTSDAITQYRTALKTAPDLYSAHLNLGLALMSIPGRQQEAIAEYQKAIASTQATLQINPDFWQAHLNLGIAYGQLPGREHSAANELRTALRLNPDSALAHFHLGNIFQKTGRFEEAINEYRASLRLDPNVAETHYELAYALARIPGRVPEAIDACRNMLMLRPDDVAGRRLMASLMEFQQARER